MVLLAYLVVNTNLLITIASCNEKSIAIDKSMRAAGRTSIAKKADQLVLIAAALQELWVHTKLESSVLWTGKLGGR